VRKRSRLDQRTEGVGRRDHLTKLRSVVVSPGSLSPEHTLGADSVD
jgi:hypothetical protein